ncbi:MAG: pentapeptide repeat-containing protein [Symploca sp. SIO2C1]|nr:pentapeptide repeat-containing protein [Symploca sp. SIO2C1]
MHKEFRHINLRGKSLEGEDSIGANFSSSNIGKDFRHANLRGKSFQGEDLTGANFSYSDIRGANFTNAILTKANFSHTQAGLLKHWTSSLVIVSLILLTISGWITPITSSWITWFFTPDFIEQHSIFAGVITLIALIIVFIAIIVQGLGIVALGVTAVVALVVSLVAGLAGIVAIISAVIGAIAVALGVAVAVAVASSAGGTIAVLVVVAVAGVRTIREVRTVAEIGFGASGALDLGGLGLLVGWSILAVTVVVAVLGVGHYIAWQALAGDDKYAWIHHITVVFASTGGTSFRQANLTDANFNYALLNNTNFLEAIITRTRWYEAKQLDLARVGDSILRQAAVRDLLVTGNGYKKSYEGANLQGTNLIGANLNQANLKKANLSHSTLQGANLEEANLAQVQANATNFRGAYLTGSCLEAWEIDSTTMLDRVDCRYIYLLEHPCPIKGDRKRRPQDPNEVFTFGSGDFEKICQSFWMNIVRIYLPKRMNREAFITTYQQLMEDNPGIIPHKLEKNNDDFVLTITLPKDTDNQKIKDYFSYLTQEKNLVPISQTSKMTGSVILGEISGSVTHVITQLTTPFKRDELKIQELLTKLQRAIEAEADLSEEDTAEALVQVATLAGAAKNPQEIAIRNLAQTAIKILNSKFASLPKNSQLVEESQKLLPIIEERLGLTLVGV